jgi:hypothetical protein
MYSYKFWTVSSGILYHYSWRTSSSCFRDVGDGNLFLTLVSKTDHSGSIILKSRDSAGQVSCWSSPSCSSNYDWTVPAVWMGALSSWKLRRCSEITFVHILPFSNLAMKADNGTNRIPRYCCPNHRRTSLVFYCWSETFRIVGFLGCSRSLNSSWCREEREGRLIWHITRVSTCLMSRFYGRDTIVYASQHYFQ